MTTIQDVVVAVPDASSNEAWFRRLEEDALAIRRVLPSGLRPLHDIVVGRARETGARGLILSGSTARTRRTEISDLDYHLVGPKIVTRDLSAELDLHVLAEADLEQTILSGDDFVQWSLRLGLIVFDEGVLRRAISFLAEHRPWPDVERKMRHASKSVDLARRFIETGDEDGALVQVRTALSLAARARLLSVGTFPLARAELPEQLTELGFAGAGEALHATMVGSVPLDRLAEAVRHCEDLLAISASD